jgi:hypothetical protein
MNLSARCFSMLRSALFSAALLLAAACASAPPQGASPPSASGTVAGSQGAAQAPAYTEDETPASQSELVASADFTANAQRQGFKPEVRNGVVVYCWSDQDIGSRLPTKKCVNQTQLQILLQQRQAQRDAMQRMTGTGCSPGINCAH